MDTQYTIYISLLSLLVIASLFIVLAWGVPSLKRVERWSIGIYFGDSPTNVIQSDQIKNPIITYKDVTDIHARSVADPFIIYDQNKWHMFFEVKTEKTRLGQIALATSSDGIHWVYKGTVLKEDFHLSYPYTFKWENEYYLVPESLQDRSVRLYKAKAFPEKWEFYSNLLSDINLVDPSLLNHRGRWYLFASSPSNDTLFLYHSDALFGPWIEHPSSPVVNANKQAARPAGRLLSLGSRVIRFAQDDTGIYGRSVRGFEISELTPSSYIEHAMDKSPIISSTNNGWNSLGMHHIDPHPLDNRTWIACVDGKSKSIFFRFKPNRLTRFCHRNI